MLGAVMRPTTESAWLLHPGGPRRCWGTGPQKLLDSPLALARVPFGVAPVLLRRRLDAYPASVLTVWTPEFFIKGDVHHRTSLRRRM
jgi:hypothetical protein